MKKFFDELIDGNEYLIAGLLVVLQFALTWLYCITPN